MHPEVKSVSLREPWLDNLKASLFLLGIIYHTRTVIFFNSWDYQYLWSSENFAIDSDFIFWLLHLFRVQTFFIVSGFLFQKTFNSEQKMKKVAHIFKRLIVPTIISLLVLLPLSSFIHGLAYSQFNYGDFIVIDVYEYTSQLFLSGQHHVSYFWYLIYLILFQLATVLLFKYFNRIAKALPFFFIAAIASTLSIPKIFEIGVPYEISLVNLNFDAFFYYFLFFISGVYASETKISIPIKSLFFTAATLILVNLMIIKLATHSSVEANFLWVLKFLTFFLSCALSLFVFGLFKKIFKRDYRVLKIVSENALSLYLFHFIYIAIGALVAGFFTSNKIIICLATITTALVLTAIHLIVSKGMVRHQ